MPSTPTRWPLVIFGLTLAYLVAFQLFKLPPLLPTLLENYGYDLTLAGGLVSVYAVTGLLVSIPGGRWIERVGPVTPILVGLVVMVVGNLLGLLQPDSGLVMLISRGLEGAAFALLAIVGPLLANRYAGPTALPLIIGLTAAWVPLGQLLATLAAPVALALTGWQGLWWLAMLLSLLVALLTLGLRQQLALPVHSNGNRPPPPGLSAPQRRALLLAGAIFMLWSCQYFAYMTWLPQYLVEVFGFSQQQALWGYTVPVTGVLIFNIVGGWILRTGIRVTTLLLVSLVLQIGVWLTLPYTGAGLLGLVSLLIYGIGAGVSPTCLFAMPSTVVGRGPAAARAFAIIMVGRNLGVLSGPILLAEAFKWTASWGVASPLFAAVTGGCFAVVLVMHWQLRALARP